VKRIVEIPETKPPPILLRHKSLALENSGLAGKFMGIWPSPKSVVDWVKKSWKPHIKGKLHHSFCGRGFYSFLFESKEDMDLIFRSRMYFSDARECT